jgi:hypothetical protein
MIRPERSSLQFSRGFELIKTIHYMWFQNDLLRQRVDPTVDIGETRGVNGIINDRIEKIIKEFDLTVEEWHYWCELANGIATK